LTTAILILIISLVLIAVEFFVPGGIFGITGGLLFCISIIVSALRSQGVITPVIFIIGAILMLYLTIKWALWKIKKKPVLFAKDGQFGFVASKYDTSLIGKKAVALTDLKPSGHIVCDGIRVQAVSERGYISKDNHVKVIGGEGARLIVRKIE